MVTQAGSRRRLSILGRDDAVDGGPKLFIRKGSGVVEGYLSGAVQKNDGRSCTDTVDAEVLLANWGGDIHQIWVIAFAGALDVGEFGGGRGWLACSGYPVTLGRRDDGQTFGGVFGMEPTDYGRFAFAVQAPVRPEEEQ